MEVLKQPERSKAVGKVFGRWRFAPDLARRLSVPSARRAAPSACSAFVVLSCAPKLCLSPLVRSVHVINLFLYRQTYRGICAEFCGAEHAKMGITVVAEDSATFRDWARPQLTNAATPNDSLAAEGRQLFESGPCTLTTPSG